METRRSDPSVLRYFPGDQLGTAALSVGGSAGEPALVSSLNRKPAIRILPSSWGRTAEEEHIDPGSLRWSAAGRGSHGARVRRAMHAGEHYALLAGDTERSLAEVIATAKA